MPRGGCALMINLFEDETRCYHGPGDDQVARRIDNSGHVRLS